MYDHSTYIGHTFHQKYKVESLLGEGRMGQVFKVTDIHSQKVLALKLVDIRQKKLPLEAIIRFKSEAETLKSLKHPNIVQYADYFQETDLHGILMEYLPLPTLSSAIKDTVMISIDTIFDILTALTEGLVYIHQKGMVHHDIKTSNIMAAIQGSNLIAVKIVDFGMAQLVDKMEHHFGGTLAYMSPEQTGILRKPVDHRADMYSLGIVFYELLTGHVPFQDEDQALLIHRQIAEIPEKPSLKRNDIPPQLEKILFKLLSKDPNDRYRTTLGLLKDIHKFNRIKQADNTIPIDFILGEEDHWQTLPHTNPFIGRKNLLSQANSLIEDIIEIHKDDPTTSHLQSNPLKTLNQHPQNPNGGVIIIEGEQGAGKSAFLSELYDTVHNQSGVFWYYSTTQRHQKQPYYCLKQLFSHLAEHVKKLNNEKQHEIIATIQQDFTSQLNIITDLIPEIRQWINQPESIMNTKLQHQDYQSVTLKILKRIAHNHHRLVIFIDDYQWLDETSKNCLTPILNAIDNLPILFAITIADSDQPATDANLVKQHPKTHHIFLPPLNNIEHRELLRQLFSSNFYELPEITDPLYQATHGNPLYTRQLLQHLIDEQALSYKDQSWHLIPETALTLIHQFSEQKTPELPLRSCHNPMLCQVITRCSTMFYQFCWDMIKQIIKTEPALDIDNQALMNILDKAVKLNILAVDNKMFYTFKSSYLKKQCQQALDKPLTIALHKTIAMTLTQLIPEPDHETHYETAQHWEAADDIKQAFQSYVNAATDIDNQNVNNPQAEMYYQLAVQKLNQLTPGEIDHQTQFDIRYQSVKHSIGHNEEYDRHWQVLEQLKPWINHNVHNQIQYIDLKSQLALFRGDIQQSLELANQVINNRDESLEIYTIDAYSRLGLFVTNKNYEERVAFLKKSIDIAFKYEVFSHSPSIVVLGIMRTYLGQFQQAKDEVIANTQVLINHHYPGAEVLRDYGLMLIEVERGDFRHALKYGEPLQNTTHLMGNLASKFYLSALALCYGMLGQTQKSFRIFEQLLEQKDKAEQQLHYLNALLNRVQVAYHLGEYESILDYQLQAERYLEIRPDPYIEVMFGHYCAHAHIALNQLSQAAQILEEEVQPLIDQLNAPLVYTHHNFALAKLHWLQNKDERFSDAAKLILEDMLHMGMTGYFERYKEDYHSWSNRHSTSTSHSTSFLTTDKDILKLLEINREITATLNLEVLFKMVLEGAMKIVGAEQGFLFTCLYDNQCDISSLSPNLKLSIKNNPKTESDHFSQSIVKAVLAKQESIVTRDAKNEKRWRVCQSVISNELKSILAVPIILKEYTKGVIYLSNHHATSVFDLRDKEIVDIFANQVAIAINNAEIYEKEQQARKASEATLTLFRRFVPKQFTDTISSGNLDTLETGLARQENLSIMFSDIRDFTTLSENLSAHALFGFLNEYLNHMERPIRQHHGFVDKFIGDAIMALFDKNPLDAVYAGLGMFESLKNYNQNRHKQGLPSLQIGIAINTGLVTIGVLGSSERMDTTVIGDAVNIASRVEGLTKVYHCTLMITGETYQHIKHHQDLKIRFIDKVQIKGKHTATELYEVFNHDPSSIQERKMRYRGLLENAFHAYQQGEWDQAIQLFRQYRQIFPEDPVVQPFLQRCQTYKAIPPGSWTGVYRLDSK